MQMTFPPRRPFRRTMLAAIAPLAMLAACAGPGTGRIPPPPAHANGMVLWHLVHDRCIPGQLADGHPAPCAQVSISAGVETGHALLKDREGIAQYLVMPTILVSGIEDDHLLRPGAPNYFTPAWQARSMVAARLGRPVARGEIAITVNSRYGRTQDLLHLHVDCLRADLRDPVRLAAQGLGSRWSARPLVLAGHRYRAIRIDGAEQVERDPFPLLAHGLHVRPAEMGLWTLALIGADFPDGKPGFVLLAGRADPARGLRGSAEELQDHSCGQAG